MRDCEQVLRVNDVVSQRGQSEATYLAGSLCLDTLVGDVKRLDPQKVGDCLIAGFVLQSRGYFKLKSPLAPDGFAGLGPLLAGFSSCAEAMSTLNELAILMDKTNGKFPAPKPVKKNCDVVVALGAQRGVTLNWPDSVPAAPLSEQYHDTYNRLRTSGEFSTAARGIETADSSGFETADSIFAGGMVDYLMSYCAVGIGAGERTRLAAFVVRSVADVQGAASTGGFDDVAAAVMESARAYKAGAAAAQRLDCAEPTSTQLLKNVYAMLTR